MLLFEIVTNGKEPFFDIDNLMEVSKFVLEGGRPNVPEENVDEFLVQLMYACWAVEPKERPSFDKM